MSNKAQKPVIRYRDAITGHYTTEKYAEEHPKTTVKETNTVTGTKQKSPPKK